MDREAMERDVARLAQIAANSQCTDVEKDEATGLAIGLAGAFIIAVVRAVDLLESVVDHAGRPAVRTRERI